VNIALAVIVFLLGCCLGLLAFLIHRFERRACRLETLLEHHTEATLYAAENAGRLAQDQGKHRDAVATVLVNEARDLAGKVLREVQSAANERRKLVQRMQLRYELGEDVPANSAPPSSDTGPPDSGAHYGARPGVSLLPPDAPTPPSGLPISSLWGNGDGAA